MYNNSRSKLLQKVYKLVPNTVDMPPPELFTGQHDGETIRQLTNACYTHFKLIGAKDENRQAFISKTSLCDTLLT